MTNKLPSKIHIAGTVTVQWAIESPHASVDTETLKLIVTDALRATFDVRPRISGPIFRLSCECTDGDVEIEEDDREEQPEEFDKDLPWYQETKDGNR